MQLAPIRRRGEKAAGSQTGTHSLFDHAPSSAELGEFELLIRINSFVLSNV